jgi:hypothetical protein
MYDGRGCWQSTLHSQNTYVNPERLHLIHEQHRHCMSGMVQVLRAKRIKHAHLHTKPSLMLILYAIRGIIVGTPHFDSQ